ncbi:serine/threonine-protein kinase [Gordonia polyisoprenivorans]|uniref:serine/threonine-protein kinase n=1 Tax=Gordonia polyisoprenivorans TaxID=84595 RepID=UPI000B99EFB6|nr:serine/threonine-protein kinase [Gordonia polyisoprenivorans]OZC32280.1 serine/threonine protein kinase [Gordonia polyisoprenivorans]
MLQPGASFAGYTIERLLGAGGMGEVYVARHPRLPRSDALKVLASSLSDNDQFRRRFEREADVVATLSHPGIVTVHDRGEANGHLWIALQLIDGTDLSEVLRTHGPMPAPEVARIVAAVADALDYAGSRGLVHRDVKPANILIETNGRLQLTDFGIAHTRTDTNTRLTATGTTIGTLDYASPEQLRGLSLDSRSDQYSLACTAFHLLAGHPPHEDTNAVAVITRHLEQPLPSLRHTRPELSHDVDAVLTRATDKDPARRFSSSSEFANALAVALRQTTSTPRQTISAPTPTPAPTVRPQPDSGHPGRPPVVFGSVQQAPAPGWPVPAPPRRRRRRPGRLTIALVLGLVAVLAITGGVLGWHFYEKSVAGAHELADLTHVPASPLSPSLATKPARVKWTYSGAGILGGTIQLAIGAHDAVTEGSEPAVFDVLDANTGKVLRSISVPVMGPDGYVAQPCVVAATIAACPMTNTTEVLLDLQRGTVVGQVTADQMVAADTGFFALKQSPGDDANRTTVMSVDSSGRVRWQEDSREYALPATGSGSALINPVQQPGSFQGPAVEIRRASDGKVLYHRVLQEWEESPAWAPFAGGFVVDGANGPEYYDLDGKRTAVGASDWHPIGTPLRAGINALPAAGPSLPVLSKGDIDRIPQTTTTIGVANPATGTILWQSETGGGRDSSSTAVGVGTAAQLTLTTNNSGTSRETESHALALYSGFVPDHVLTDLRSQSLIADDGTRTAFASSSENSCETPIYLANDCTTTLTAYGSDGNQLWDLNSQGTPEGFAGMVFIGTSRII